MDKATLESLLERVEKATGPDREIDRAIYFAMECTPIPPEGFDMSWAVGKPHIETPNGKWTHHRDGVPTDGTLSPQYTASIDAAVGLAESVIALNGRKLICFFCAGGQLMPYNANEGSPDYHPLAKIDNSVTAGWLAHIAFMKDSSSETYGPERYSHGRTAGLAICAALFRALIARCEA